MKKAIVLLSGGLDSTTVLAMAKEAGFEIYALSFEYGQRHKIELEFAKKIAANYQVQEHKIAKIDLGIFGGSALTDKEIAVPKGRALEENINSRQIIGAPLHGDPHSKTDNNISKNLFCYKIPVTYVPARNTIFLSYALAYAEVVGAFDIFIGVNAIDYSGYPDCRPEFIEAFAKMASLATAAGVENAHKFSIHAPLIKMSKAQIIEAGTKIGVDYSKTYSCYDPIIDGENLRSCGKCDSCRLRAEGFRQAGLQDGGEK